MFWKLSRILILFTCLSFFGCGLYGRDIREGYRVLEEEERIVLVEGLLNKSIDRWNEVYGECRYNVGILLEPEYWVYQDQLVAGLYWGKVSSNSCVISIGVNRTSECATAMVLWHELYHCCFDDRDHEISPGEEDRLYARDRMPEGTTNWTHGLWYMMDDYRKAGQCEENPDGLYNSYPFGDKNE